MLTGYRTPSRDEVDALMQEARRMRAEAFRGALRRVFRAIAAPFRLFAEARRQRDLAVSLYHLSDSQLKDIGISRQDIPAIAAGIMPPPMKPRLKLVENDPVAAAVEEEALQRAA